MKPYIFYFALFLTTVAGFFLLVPKVSSRVFPFVRHPMLNDFMEASKKNQSIDAKEFWILREYYSPGSFVFKEKGLTQKEIEKRMKQFNLTFNKKTYIYPYLLFNSDTFNSIEALTTDTDLSHVIQNFSAFKGKNCIIDQKSTSICYRNDHVIQVVFIKPMNEMQKTNGFFDYKRKDLHDLTKGKYWLVISTIYEK